MQLTRNRIIGAAMELIEQEGIDAVSMRRLATELGCGVMSLYSYVPSKAALLDAVAEVVMSGIECTPIPDDTWAERVRVRARAFRQLAREHPLCTMLAVSRPVTSVAQLRALEHALETLREAGLSGEESIRLMRAFGAYILGSLLGEVGVAPALAGSEPASGPAAWSRRTLKAKDFPQVTNLAAELSRNDPDADFDFGLELLVRAAAMLLEGPVAQ
jgi:AcrR family transcriptional regulator